MEDSFTERLLKQQKKNEDVLNNNNLTNTNLYDSSEYHPDQFGLGTFSGKVLEEIKEDHDNWENFMTTMFLIGIILIPLQMIFADKIKPFDLYLIKLIQKYVYTNNILTNEYLFSFFIFCSSMNFYMSITVFFYHCFDCGIAFKTSLVGSFGSFLVFIFKLIIHDSRPFWIDSSIICRLCKLSFGSPSLDCFVGMLYSHYMYFCTERALMSDDKFINKSRKELIISRYLSITLMIVNYLNGLFYICIGMNFIYQILVSYFYGFIVIRIVQVFNKEIDSFANGARYILSISNAFFIYVMFTVCVLSIISSITYNIISDNLLLPKEFAINIENWCKIDAGENDKISVKYTFVESTVLFYILGATMGINFLIKYLKNYSIWIVTSFEKRILRGIIGFTVNLSFLLIVKYIQFRNIINVYFVLIIIYLSTGFICYGLLPKVFEIIRISNLITQFEEKKAKMIGEELILLSNKHYEEDTNLMNI